MTAPVPLTDPRIHAVAVNTAMHEHEHKTFSFLSTTLAGSTYQGVPPASKETVMTSALDQHTVLPPVEADALVGLAMMLGPDIVTSRAKLVGPAGTTVELPDEVYEVLRQVVAAMSEGLAINIASLPTVLTTHQAADMLNISRPTLVKLLEEGKIPYDKPGHRKVRLADLLEYQQQARAARRAALDEMTALGSEEESDLEADNVDRIIQTR